MPPREPSTSFPPERPLPRQGPPWWFTVPALTGALLAAAYVAFVFAPAQRAEVVDTWRSRLIAMTEERTASISRWAVEGAANARTVASYPSVIRLLNRPDLAAATASDWDDLVGHVSTLLESFRAINGFDTVFVFDPGGGTVAGAPAQARADETCRQAAMDVLRAGETTVDVGRHSNGEVSVLFRAVVRNPALPAGPALGVVLLARSAGYWLYPLLARDPTYTGTGEAQLFRVDGSRVLLVSPMRHRGDPPHTYWHRPGTLLRDAMKRGDAPVFGRFVDYRGTPVLGAARVVPNTPWNLVVKVDEAEALTGYRARLIAASAMAAAVSVALVAMAGLLWTTQRRRYEAEILRREARLGLLLEHANDGILFVDPTTLRIVGCNRQAERIYGRERHGLVGTPVPALRTPSDQARARDDAEQTAALEGAIFESEHVRADGSAVPVEVSSRLVDLGGERLYFSIVRDISERKAAQAAIDRLHRLLRTISEVHQAIVRESDADRLAQAACRILVEREGFALAWIGRVEPSNRAVPLAAAGPAIAYLDRIAERLAAPEPDNPIVVRLVAGDPVVLNDLAAGDVPHVLRETAVAHGFRSVAFLPMRTADRTTGTLHVYSTRAHTFVPEQTALLRDLAADLAYALQAIEQRKELRRTTDELRANEEEVRRLNLDLERRVAQRTAQLEAANRELEAFSYSVSHDLRAPLRAIDGFGQILQEDYASALDADGLRLLEVVRDSTRRMGHLIDDLLAFSRAGRTELRRVRVDVASMAAAVIEDCLPADQHARYDVRIGPAPAAVGDPGLVRQVLTNLISNALKFSARQERPDVQFGYEATPRGPAYFVRDNGVGFDPRYAHKLFGVFQRLHSQRDFEGTGVGLALVQRIVQRHGGDIWAASTPGGGATFWFTLPTEAADGGS